MAAITDYQNLVTSEHIGQPKFQATIAAAIQPLVDQINSVLSLPALFDVDVAVGQQLDFVGQWVGVSRLLNVPILSYFSFDTAGFGFDQGSWFGPNSPVEGIVVLDDQTYRTLIYAKIAANMWDGTTNSAEKILANIFVNLPGTNVFIQDNRDMSITIGVTGVLPSALFQAMLAQGYFFIRGAGVLLNGVFIDQGPFFGFDIENFNVSGFDVGVWAGGNAAQFQQPWDVDIIAHEDFAETGYIADEY